MTNAWTRILNLISHSFYGPFDQFALCHLSHSQMGSVCYGWARSRRRRRCGVCQGLLGSATAINFGLLCWTVSQLGDISDQFCPVAQMRCQRPVGGDGGGGHCKRKCGTIAIIVRLVPPLNFFSGITIYYMRGFTLGTNHYLTLPQIYPITANEMCSLTFCIANYVYCGSLDQKEEEVRQQISPFH